MNTLDIDTSLRTATPRCPHFGTCGGCQYQDIPYDAQRRLKRAHLTTLLAATGITSLPEIVTHSAEPYLYRNRIRLRIERGVSNNGSAGALRLGYNLRATTEFLPITTCPISAPVLFQTAEALLSLEAGNRDAAHWLNAAAEVELFCNDDLSRLQLTLFCAPRTKAPQGSFNRMMNALQALVPQLAGAQAAAFDHRTGPTGRVLAEHGSPGLNYRVAGPLAAAETYWITRGGFFQVNRFLLPQLVELVCREGAETDRRPRSGKLAWDLFAGVGLFTRVLARSFAQVTAVESNPTAVADLSAALTKLPGTHTAIASTTLDFLRRALTQREWPDLIVLDPPRAGAGVEACELIARLAPHSIVYVSCDPTTLARDLTALALLQPNYTITALHLVDLFPQTFHIETVAILSRNA